MALNRFHRQLLTAVERGADVFDRRTAVTLRQLAHQGLVAITKAQGDYGPCDQHPYFGAITTREGRLAIRGGKP